MKMILIAFLLVFMSSVYSAAAQEQEPAPWPPEDLAALFGPNVELVEMRMPKFVAPAYSNTPSYNNATRQIIYRDSQYPYPIRFEGEVIGNSILPNGIIQTGNALYMREGYQDEVHYWYLNLNTGEWLELLEQPQELQTNCGFVPFRGYSAADWIPLDGGQGSQHLCQVMTGARTPALPQDYDQWEVLRSLSTVDLMLLRAHKRDASENQRILFGYQLTTQQFTEYGPIAPISIDIRLLNEHTIVLIPRTQNGDQQVQEIDLRQIVIDLQTTQRTVFPAATAWIGDHAIYIQNTGDGFEAVCEFELADPARLNVLQLVLNTSCMPDFAKEEIAYFRIVNEDMTRADFVRLNRHTGEIQTFYSGELEFITWVSPDERYAGIIVGNNGTINDPPATNSFFHAAGDETLQVIRLEDQSVLFEVDAETAWMAGTWWPNISMINADTISAYKVSGPSWVVELNQEPVIVTEVQDTVIGRDDWDGWQLVYGPPVSEFGNTNRLSLYDPESRQSFLLVDTMTFDPYYVVENRDIQYLGDDTFEIMIIYDTTFFTHVPQPEVDTLIFRLHVNRSDAEQN
jgi:hypothetical protein